MWWKLLGRGKRTIALDLKDADDLAVMLRLCDEADVLIENFRPGTLERLGLGPDVLLARNPRLVITRVTGFGQDGPYASRPGFATIAEAMSGFAAINGEPDGGPLLPPIALTDEVTGLVAAFATMVGVHSGVGQVVDVNLLESLFQLMGPLIARAAMLGYEQPRMGSGIPYSVPRGTYQCADGEWVAVSTSAESVAAPRDGTRRCSRTTLGSPRSPDESSTATRSTTSCGRGSPRDRRRRCSPRSSRPSGDRAGDDDGRHRRRPALPRPRRDRRGRRRHDAGPDRPACRRRPAASDGPGVLSMPTATRSVDGW